MDGRGRIRLLLGETAFIHNLDPAHKDGAAYVLRDDGLALASRLGATDTHVELNLVVHVMRIAVLKRLESSSDAFRRSLPNRHGAPSRLIASAVPSIAATFQQKPAHGLQVGNPFALLMAEDRPAVDEAASAPVTLAYPSPHPDGLTFRCLNPAQGSDPYEANQLITSF